MQIVSSMDDELRLEYGEIVQMAGSMGAERSLHYIKTVQIAGSMGDKRCLQYVNTAQIAIFFYHAVCVGFQMYAYSKLCVCLRERQHLALEEQ